MRHSTSQSSGSIAKEERDSELYYDDGNIVVSAQDNEGNTTYFRLHRTILSKHSPVFEGMFSMPAPPLSDIDQYDDAPLVKLHDDPEALRGFFSFLYQPQATRFKRIDPNFALDVIGPLRLAKKYQVDWVVEAVISHLEGGWPRTLSAWDKMEQDVQKANLKKKPHAGALNLIFPEPVATVHLAREFQVASIFPIAFYHLSRLSPSPAFDNQPGTYFSSGSARRSLLTIADMKTLMEGRVKVGIWLGDTVMAIIEANKDRACGNPWCWVLQTSVWMILQSEILQTLDVLKAFETEGSRGVVDRLCKSCRTHMNNDLQEARKSFFQDLGRFFVL